MKVVLDGQEYPIIRVECVLAGEIAEHCPFYRESRIESSIGRGS